VNPDIQEWHEKFDHLVPLSNVVVADSTRKISDGKNTMVQNHGNFDNDIALLMSIIKQIAGTTVLQVTDLSED